MKKAEILCLCVMMAFWCLMAGGCGEKTEEKENLELVYEESGASPSKIEEVREFEADLSALFGNAKK